MADDSPSVEHLMICQGRKCGHDVGKHWPNDERVDHPGCLACARDGRTCEMGAKEVWTINVQNEINGLQQMVRARQKIMGCVRRSIPKLQNVMDRQVVADALRGRE